MENELYTVRGPFGEFCSVEWAQSEQEAIVKMLGPSQADQAFIYSASIEG